MVKLSLDEEAVVLIKSGLNLKKCVLKLNLEEYRKRLSAFELKHNMSSHQFLRKFNSGQLGDEQYLFDWLFAHKTCKELSKKLSLLNHVKL
ncbi:MAG: hypothetical protein ABIH71_05045 [Candidatus Omnitrophota bacterium]|nr:hypothetical protein [Candidatus Omnitrophota bacterium]